jgi:hypothetical protein
MEPGETHQDQLDVTEVKLLTLGVKTLVCLNELLQKQDVAYSVTLFPEELF